MGMSMMKAMQILCMCIGWVLFGLSWLVEPDLNKDGKISDRKAHSQFLALAISGLLISAWAHASAARGVARPGHIVLIYSFTFFALAWHLRTRDKRAAFVCFWIYGLMAIAGAIIPCVKHANSTSNNPLADKSVLASMSRMVIDTKDDPYPDLDEEAALLGTTGRE